MGYEFAAYQADRAMLDLPPMMLLDKDRLWLKRRRLALDGEKRDQAAIDAAYERLVSWKESGDPVPEPPKPKAPPKAKANGKGKARPEESDLATPAGMTEAGKQAWQAMLSAQQARHMRRRQAYPDVRPRPQG